MPPWETDPGALEGGDFDYSWWDTNIGEPRTFTAPRTGNPKSNDHGSNSDTSIGSGGGNRGSAGGGFVPLDGTVRPDLDWWLLTHPPYIPGIDPNTGRDPNAPIDKGGNPHPPGSPGPDIGGDGCSAKGGDKEALRKGTEDAQKTLRDNLDNLEAMLSQCGDDRMSNLIGTLRSEADPSYTDRALGSMGCGEPKSQYGTPEAQTNYATNADGYTGNNSMTININLIRKTARKIADSGRNPETDPDEYPKILQDLLRKDILHELIHNSTGKDDNPLLTELDAQVLTQMLGDPRDPAGIDGNTWQSIKDDSDKKRGSGNPNTNGSPWLKGSFFSWNPATGEVQCGKGNSIGTIPIH